MRKLLEHLNQVFEEGEKRKKIEKGWAEKMAVRVSAREIPNETKPELYEIMADWNEDREYWIIETPKGYEDLYDGDTTGGGDINWEPSVEAEKIDIDSCDKVLWEIEERGLRGKEALNFFNQMSKEKYSSVIFMRWSDPYSGDWGIYVFGKK